ncbi:MAG: hypothetical protein GY774_16360 [Planctomycetes bacterium]|nr:hypothetical protein [Planctomycetota bacterium]
MSFQFKSDIDDLESKLENRYENLKEKLRGEELSEKEQEYVEDNLYSPRVKIKPRELRLAIDDFSTILKEIKKICK